MEIQFLKMFTYYLKVYIINLSKFKFHSIFSEDDLFFVLEV